VEDVWKVPLSRKDFLTEKERRLLDAIAEWDSVKAAATQLRISERTAYNMLYRIRNKYRNARGFINTILAYRRKSARLDQVLTKRVPMEALEEEEAGEVE
jgi:DNA-binding NarL/FixJ family response regulator